MTAFASRRYEFQALPRFIFEDAKQLAHLGSWPAKTVCYGVWTCDHSLQVPCNTVNDKGRWPLPHPECSAQSELASVLASCVLPAHAVCQWDVLQGRAQYQTEMAYLSRLTFAVF